MNNYQVLYKNNLAELDRINSDIEMMSEKWNFSPELSMNLNLVMEEIFTNIINYGFRDNQTHEILFDFQYDNKNLSIAIVDDGIPFNPIEEVKSPDMTADIDDIPIGGLGFHIVKELMDKITYNRIDNKNHLTLYKEVRT